MVVAMRITTVITGGIVFFFQMILENLFWEGGLAPLESVGKHEPHVDKMRQAVVHCIEQALIPLQAYAQKYDQFLELFNMDVEGYLS